MVFGVKQQIRLYETEINFELSARIKANNIANFIKPILLMR